MPVTALVVSSARQMIWGRSWLWEMGRGGGCSCRTPQSCARLPGCQVVRGCGRGGHHHGRSCDLGHGRLRRRDMTRRPTCASRKCRNVTSTWGVRYTVWVSGPGQPEGVLHRVGVRHRHRGEHPPVDIPAGHQRSDLGIPPTGLIDLTYGARQESFVQRVKDAGLTAQQFANPDDLRGRVAEALRDLVATKQRVKSGLIVSSVPHQRRRCA